MPRKILVIHSTSLVGKSTIVVSLLHPRLKSPRVFSVERQNQDASRYGIDVKKYHGSELKNLVNDILLEQRDLVVDIGASQYAEVMKEYARVRGAINDFDIVIVPTTPDGRVQEETLGTIATLRKVGLHMDKLRVLFNRAEIDEVDDLDTQFESVVAYLVTEGLPKHDDLVLFENPIHSDLRAAGLSFAIVANDKKDYKKLAHDAVAKAPKSPETASLITRLTIQRAVESATENLDQTFRALRLPSSAAAPVAPSET